MYTFSMQSLLKSGMVKSSKSSLMRFYSKKQTIKSMKKNHYDTLQITPYATNNEIKSAYYQLTLQYHPDKNNSEYAKQKFQDISEAYEVLGNHELRRSYDQRMRIQRPSVSTTARPDTGYKNRTYPQNKTMYNFDAWIQAHYGRQMEMTNILREKQRLRFEECREKKPSKSSNNFQTVFFLTTLLITLVFASRQNKDIPVKKVENDTNNR